MDSFHSSTINKSTELFVCTYCILYLSPKISICPFLIFNSLLSPFIGFKCAHNGPLIHYYDGCFKIFLWQVILTPIPSRYGYLIITFSYSYWEIFLILGMSDFLSKHEHLGYYAIRLWASFKFYVLPDLLWHCCGANFFISTEKSLHRI